MRCGLARSLPSAGTAFFLASAIVLVDRCPGAAFRFLAAHAALLVAFGDMIGLSLLLSGVLRFLREALRSSRASN